MSRESDPKRAFLTLVERSFRARTRAFRNGTPLRPATPLRVYGLCLLPIRPGAPVLLSGALLPLTAGAVLVAAGGLTEYPHQDRDEDHRDDDEQDEGYYGETQWRLLIARRKVAGFRAGTPILPQNTSENVTEHLRRP